MGLARGIITYLEPNQSKDIGKSTIFAHFTQKSITMGGRRHPKQRQDDRQSDDNDDHSSGSDVSDEEIGRCTYWANLIRMDRQNVVFLAWKNSVFGPILSLIMPVVPPLFVVDLMLTNARWEPINWNLSLLLNKHVQITPVATPVESRKEKKGKKGRRRKKSENKLIIQRLPAFHNPRRR